jgi:hypothetical protein
MASSRRETVLDRVVRWILDPDGDIYGDERERLRWYEAITVAASLQWIGVPWAATVLVWILGRPAVLPLGVVLAVLYAPMIMCVAWVRRRSVDTTVRSWTSKRIVLSVLGTTPYVLFIVGCIVAYQQEHPSVFRGALVGAIGGAVLAAAAAALGTRRRRRREAAAVADEDLD